MTCRLSVRIYGCSGGVESLKETLSATHRQRRTTVCFSCIVCSLCMHRSAAVCAGRVAQGAPFGQEPPYIYIYTCIYRERGEGDRASGRGRFCSCHQPACHNGYCALQGLLYVTIANVVSHCNICGCRYRRPAPAGRLYIYLSIHLSIYI